MRAVLYARVSGDDRQNEARNLLGQLEMCRSYAQTRGYDIIAELAEDDRGASGAAFELPQLGRARHLAQSHAYDVLVTRELDRLSRRLAKQLFVEDELQRNGVRIEYALAEYAPTPEGGLMKNIRASFAEYERLKITERMTRGRRQKVAAGSVLVCNNPPYGYRSVQMGRDWQLAVEPEEAEVVRDIFTWYATGVSIRGIAVRLSQQGVPTAFDKRPGRAGQKKRERGVWSRASVHNILTNETYCGVWRYGKAGQTPLTVSVPALVERELWQRAQAQISVNVDHSPRSTKLPYLLRRRVVCGECGSKLRASYSGSAEQNYRYYRCPATAAGQQAHTCDLPALAAPQAEDRVWAELRTLLLTPAALANGLQRLAEQSAAAVGPLQAQLARAERELAQVGEEQVRLAGLYVRGSLPVDALDRLAGELAVQARAHETRVAQLRAELAQATTGPGAPLADLADIAAGLSEAEADFEFRRLVVERLDLQAQVTVVDGRPRLTPYLVVAGVPALLGGEEGTCTGRIASG